MRLVASVVVRNEMSRYLALTIPHMFTYCDEVCVLDDASTDGSADWLEANGCKVLRQAASTFYVHEGRTRDALLNWTLAHEPTHVIAIDADEFITDGKKLRTALETSDCPTFQVDISEVWKCDTNQLWTREDGGWRTHPVTFVWRVPETRTVEWWIRDAALACGRTPQMVEEYERLDCTDETEVGLLHFGWANADEREQRYQRYVEHDGGRFHSRTHLDSIMWPDQICGLRETPWPKTLAPRLRDKIVRATNGMP